jgi:dolichol-phosphate mannosyltransferase
MSLTLERRTFSPSGSVSLIIPLTPGSSFSIDTLEESRRILADEIGYHSIQVIIVRNQAATFASISPETASIVSTAADNWPGLVRAGLAAATGEHLVVFDVDRHYSTEALAQVLGPLRQNRADLAIAVPRKGESSFAVRMRALLGSSYISRLMLGTSDVFSGLFALNRTICDSSTKHSSHGASNLVLDSWLRWQARAVDVPVIVGDQFQTEYLGFKDLRPLKRILDGRFGNYSRLVQFCVVGASGMVIDLSTYAILQYALSFTALAHSQSALFGDSWHLVIAAALSIAVALVWNFTLNRRLTFNDARKGALHRQFLTYVVSNLLAIILSFSVRLYLPANVGFFARHRLAAAVVGIVAATAISFSMSRWLVFGRRNDLGSPPQASLENSAVG